MKTIYVDGGSTAFGMFDQERGGWAHRLHTDTLAISAERMSNPAIVVNRAIPGRTLPAIMRTFGTEVENHYRSGNTVAAVLQVGVNEAKVFEGMDNSIVSLNNFGKRLLEFCDVTAMHNVPTVFVGPQPIDGEVHTTLGCTLRDTTVREYADVMRHTAQTRDVTYIDTAELFLGHDLDDILHKDGYHPNALGHTLLHGAISEALTSLHAL